MRRSTWLKWLKIHEWDAWNNERMSEFGVCMTFRRFFKVLSSQSEWPKDCDLLQFINSSMIFRWWSLSYRKITDNKKIYLGIKLTNIFYLLFQNFDSIWFISYNRISDLLFHLFLAIFTSILTWAGQKNVGTFIN